MHQHAGFAYEVDMLAIDFEVVDGELFGDGFGSFELRGAAVGEAEVFAGVE